MTQDLLGHADWWREYWRGMPEFIQEDLMPRHSIQVDFESKGAVENFSKLVGQRIGEHSKQTLSIWHPEAEEVSRLDKRYITDSPILPKYPVYIISKGRWGSEKRRTSLELERMNVPYHIVVEPQERDRYAMVINPAKILVLPFSNLGQGSIPARNWVWEHSIKSGAERHWILDDNIMGFYRLNRNMKLPTTDGAMFRAAEDFVDRYDNVGLAGFQYWMFAPRKHKLAPISLNTRIYSCILIKNDLDIPDGRWRGRYNEDTDLSIRVLKQNLCTVLFYAFIADKSTTMTGKGGNTDELYKGTEKSYGRWSLHAKTCDVCWEMDGKFGKFCDEAKSMFSTDGRWLMAESLREQHPDITQITRKWDRWQHNVNYDGFRTNALRLKPGIEIHDVTNDYGMRLHYDNPDQARGAA